MQSRRSTLSTQMISVCHGLPVQPANPLTVDHVNYILSSGTYIQFGYMESAKTKVSCDRGPGKKCCSLKSKKAWHNSCGPCFYYLLNLASHLRDPPMLLPLNSSRLIIHLNYLDCFAFVCNICGVFQYIVKLD